MNPEKLRTTIPAEETPIDEGKPVEYLDNFEEEADPDTVRKRGEKAIRTAEQQTDNLAESREKAQQFTRRYGRNLSLFSRDSSLQFEMSADASTFAFDASSFKVLVPLEWFSKGEYNENELLFANYHERAHFIDMRKNPKAYLGNFERMRTKSRELAADYCADHQNETRKEGVKKFFYDELHTLYNCLDDIYVNDMVRSRVPLFNDGDGAKSITTLYDKLGYSDQDLTGQPLHRQLVFSLLRDAMISKERGMSKVDERVEEVLNKKTLGKTLRSTVQTELRTRAGILRDPEERYKLIRTIIEPAYLKLLEESLNDQDIPDDGEFAPFGDADEQFKEGLDKGENSDKIAKEILDALADKEKEDKMSPQERAKYQAEKRKKDFDKAHGITEKERGLCERISQTIREPRKKMREFWTNIIGKSMEYKLRRVGGQRRGRLDINSFINRYPDVVDAERNGDLRSLEVYQRSVLEHELIDKPDRIEATLLVDCSGSMTGDKTEMARKTAALLMYSLKDFNDELERTRRQTHSKLKTDSQVLVFGTEFSEAKPFAGDRGVSQADADIIKSISAINSDMSGTNDAAPLGWLGLGITDQQRQSMHEKKLKKIIFVITDGGSQSEDESRANVVKLAEDGVIMVAFQIGSVSPEDEQTFKKVWASDSRDSKHIIKGIQISDVEQLPNELMKELSDALNDIAI